MYNMELTSIVKQYNKHYDAVCQVITLLSTFCALYKSLRLTALISSKKNVHESLVLGNMQ